jgi:hypothetical protein
MRILFALPYPGYLRYFDTTVLELASRGHVVDLWFEMSHKQAEALRAFPAHPGVHICGVLPKRRDPWARTAVAVRGLTDLVRYLDPVFRDALYLRRRAATKAPRGWRGLARAPSFPHPLVSGALAVLKTAEEAIPRGPVFERLLDAERPDVVLASPLVNWSSRQADLVRSARARGIPTAALIASWDNLTTKGLLRVMPDRVVVWNRCQADEAELLHGVPRSRTVITGAQPFDKWFGRRPTRDRAAFCARVGLPDERPYVLFVGSTESITAPDAERAFVHRWVGAIRASTVERVASLAVLVRPHPYNSSHWDGSELEEFERTAVYPRDGANPVDDDDRADYFDSLAHSVAVVGINTSAMIEAAVVGRSVLTVTAHDFDDTQMGTLHFRYLVPEGGGFVLAARSLDEHIDQLADVLRDTRATSAQVRGFVRRFVRPHGLDRPATPILVEAIERFSTLAPEPRDTERGRLRCLVLRVLLLPGPARWLVSEFWKRASWKLWRGRAVARSAA